MTIRLTSPELLKLAEKELNEIPSRRMEDIESIKNWMQKQSHLNGRTDNQWILTFLRGSKFSLERTKEKLAHYYKMRTVVPEFLTNRDPFLPEIQQLLNSGICVPLNKSSDPIAPRVLFLQCNEVHTETISVVNMIKVTLMILDILTNEDDSFVIAGHIVLQDFQGIGIHHVVQLTPGLVKNMMACLQHSFPSRPKQFHFINTPALFCNLFNLVKPFMLEKLQDRVRIYNYDYQSNLYDSISKDILPAEYGGEGGSINNLIGEWKRKVESYREWFLEDERYSWTNTVDSKSSVINDDFGTQGSFRKLSID